MGTGSEEGVWVKHPTELITAFPNRYQDEVGDAIDAIGVIILQLEGEMDSIFQTGSESEEFCKKDKDLPAMTRTLQVVQLPPKIHKIGKHQAFKWRETDEYMEK